MVFIRFFIFFCIFPLFFWRFPHFLHFCWLGGTLAGWAEAGRTAELLAWLAVLAGMPCWPAWPDCMLAGWDRLDDLDGLCADTSPAGSTKMQKMRKTSEKQRKNAEKHEKPNENQCFAILKSRKHRFSLGFSFFSAFFLFTGFNSFSLALIPIHWL